MFVIGKLLVPLLTIEKLTFNIDKVIDSLELFVKIIINLSVCK